MVLVTIRDLDPLVEMKCCEIDPRTLHQQWGSLVKKVMDSVQEHCPNFDESLYRCLQSPDEWLNDHVIVQFVKHLQNGMPVPDQAVSDVVFDPVFFDFKHEGKNKIDFGEVCILDTHTEWQIGQAHLSGDYETILRVLAGQCTFSDVKRLLLPMNVSIGDKDGMVIEETAKGNNFILGELLLCTDAVLAYDWLGDTKSSAYYNGVTGAPEATVCYCPQTSSTCNFCCAPTDPLLALLRVMKDRCDGMIVSTVPASVTVPKTLRSTVSIAGCGHCALCTPGPFDTRPPSPDRNSYSMTCCGILHTTPCNSGDTS
jgi:hypothetical protein